MNGQELGILKGQFDIIKDLLEKVIADTQANTRRLDRWNGGVIAMEKQLGTELDSIKKTSQRIEIGLNNHLKHHEEKEKEKRGKTFNILMVIFHLALYTAVGILLLNK